MYRSQGAMGEYFAGPSGMGEFFAYTPPGGTQGLGEFFAYTPPGASGMDGALVDWARQEEAEAGHKGLFGLGEFFAYTPPGMGGLGSTSEDLQSCQATVAEANLTSAVEREMALRNCLSARERERDMNERMMWAVAKFAAVGAVAMYAIGRFMLKSKSPGLWALGGAVAGGGGLKFIQMREKNSLEAAIQAQSQ